LKRLRWKEEDLENYRKSNSRKVKIARRLRQETTMTSNWIAGQLKMGAGAAYGTVFTIRKNELV
jgi:hypothetical protein